MLVGGFLGAGKTSLILAASRVLLARGKRAAVILNDQGDELVDTELADRQGVLAGQVTGGCFCCRFSDLVEAGGAAAGVRPGRDLRGGGGELHRYHRDDDPAAAAGTTGRASGSRRLRWWSIRGPGTTIQNCASCSSSRSRRRTWWWSRRATLGRGEGGRRTLSSRTGEGVAEWLDEVLSGGLTAGGHPMAVDYERYARAEAALAWLNCRVVARLPDCGFAADADRSFAGHDWMRSCRRRECRSSI